MSNYQYHGPSWVLNRREGDQLIEFVNSTTALSAFDDSDVLMVCVCDGVNIDFYRDTSLTNPSLVENVPDIVLGLGGRTWRRQNMNITITSADWIGLPEIV